MIIEIPNIEIMMNLGKTKKRAMSMAGEHHRAWKLLHEYSIKSMLI
jgi:hypothetical protein